MSDKFLTYAVSSNPDPIQASPQTGDPSLATLMIVVSNQTRSLIDCQSISFGFLKGKNAKDFFPDATGIGTSTQTGWSIKPDEQDSSIFTATPDTPENGKIGAEGLTFVLSNIKVNEQPGTTDMTVTEVTTSNTRTLTIPLSKFPPQFSVGPLQANPVNIATGESTTLTWSGSGGDATYELQYEDADGNTVTITHVKGDPDTPLPSTGSYKVNNLQTDPTVFTLIVMLQDDDGDSPPQVQRQVVVAVSQLTVDFEAAPTSVAPNGVTKLIWKTTQATSCTLDPGNQTVPVNGHQYVIIPPDKANQVFTLTAYGDDGLSKPVQVTVSVDSTIVPTNTLSAAGANGAHGADGASTPYYYEGPPGGAGSNGGDGLPGSYLFTRKGTLDPSSKPSKVWLIDSSGGNGGTGGAGGAAGYNQMLGYSAGGGNAGNGGNGADGGMVTLVFDPAADTPAGYIVTSRGGKGGAAGTGGGGSPPGANGTPGQNGHDGQIILKDASEVMQQLQPQITLFQAKSNITSDPWKLTLNWDTSHADYCEISSSVNQLKPSSTDDSYELEWTWGMPPTATYTLTAKNSVGWDTSTISVDWGLQLIASVDLGDVPSGLALLADNSRLYALFGTGVKILDPGTLQVIGSYNLPPGGYPSSIALTQQTFTRMYITFTAVQTPSTPTMMGLDPNTLEPVDGLESTAISNPMGVVFSPDGNSLYVISRDNTLNKLSPWGSTSLQGSLPIDNKPQALAISPDGTRLYVGTPTDLRIIDAATLQPIGNPVPINSPGTSCLAASPDTLLYVANYNGSPMAVLDATTLQPIAQDLVPPVGGAGQQIAISPDGRRVYLACADRKLYVFARMSITGGKQPT